MGEDKLAITLDSELLLPIKQELEQAIDRLLKVSVALNKETEVNLKITLQTRKERRTNSLNASIVPEIEYKVSEKIKEYKTSSKNTLGRDFEINETEDGLIIEKYVDQESLFDEEEEEE